MTTLLTRPALLLCGALCLGSASAAPEAEPGLAIVVKPLVTAGQVSALDVRQQLTHGAPAGGALLRFNAPLALYGVPVLAAKITGLQVSDAHGALPLTTEDDPKQQGYTTAYRHWQATRPAVYPVTVQYRIGTELVTQSGPPFGMKPSGGGVAGNGLGFLLLPENTSSTATRFSWDLSQLPAGAIGVITAGAGSVVVPGAPDAVLTQWMLAGPARVFTSTRTLGFQAYMLGEPPFDATAILDWSDRAYAYLAASLVYLGAPPYRLFFRSLDAPTYATGTARPDGGGALMTVGPAFGKQTLGEFKNAIFHEMTHQWVGMAPHAGAWFVEGLTTYLSAVMPCQGGLESAQFCADGVNKFADDYYGAEARNWSLEKIEVTPREEVRMVPYGRSLLYFGQLNAQLLAHSKGRRNVQDVVAQLFKARAQGVEIDDAAWEAMLLRELGQGAVAEFRASVIDGTTTIVPPADAFGPCLTRFKVAMAVKGTATNVDGYHWRPVACSKQNG